MSRSVGLSVFSSNFETRVAAPLDSRMLVDALADLHATATWQSGDGSYYAYKGMLVCVCNDTEENNGVYRLATLPYTTSSNWVKLGSGTGTGFTWYPDDTPPDVPEIGDAYYDTALGKSRVWSDGAWRTVANDGNDGAQGLPSDPVPLSDSSPAALGSATAGVSTSAARGDHVHPTTGLVLASEKGAVNGLASLGADGKVPASQLSQNGSGIEVSVSAPAAVTADDVGRVILFTGTTTADFISKHFYKATCIVGEGASGYLVSGAGLLAVNGIYTPNGETFNGQPVYTMVNGETTYYLYYQYDDDPTYGWVIYNSKTNSAGGDFYAHYYCEAAIDGTWSVGVPGYGGTPPAPSVAAYDPIFYSWEDITADVVRSVLGIDTAVGSELKVLSEKGNFVSRMPITHQRFARPYFEAATHLVVQAAHELDFSDTVTIIDTANVEADRAKVIAYNGAVLMACPETGFGDNFSGQPVRVDLSAITETCILRYKWVSAAGDSDWYVTFFPSNGEAYVAPPAGISGETPAPSATA